MATLLDGARLGLRRRLGALRRRARRRPRRLRGLGPPLAAARRAVAALLRDARRGGADGPVRHPRPPGPREDVGRAAAGARGRPAPLLRAGDGRHRRVAASPSRSRRRGCASRSASCTRRRRSWRCASTRAARSRCRATRTCRATSGATTRRALELLESVGRDGAGGLRAAASGGWRRSDEPAARADRAWAGTRTASRPGAPLILGGVEFEDAELGLDGHSDADVLTHAVMDALLGRRRPRRHRRALPRHRRRLRGRRLDRAAARGRRDAGRARGLRDRARRHDDPHGAPEDRPLPRRDPRAAGRGARARGRRRST